MTEVTHGMRFLGLLLSLGCVAAPQALGPVPVNTIHVGAANLESVWESTVDLLHEYQFEIERENKLDGVIETRYKVGSGILEPWHRDSIGLENRLESSLQSIRRRVFVSITPDGAQGHLVSIEVFKEIEDLGGLAANSASAATFGEAQPLQRDLNPVVGQTAVSGWIPQGRDYPLEQDMRRNLQSRISGQ